MSRPKDKLPIHAPSFSSLSLKQLQMELRKRQANNREPIVDGAVRITENGYLAHIQRGQEKIREKRKQELLAILQPLNDLTLQSIATISIKEIRTVGSSISFFKEKLEINLQGFMVKVFAEIREKLKNLLKIAKNLPIANQRALRHMITYLNIEPNPIQCRSSQDRIKFFSPTKEHSLTQRVRILKENEKGLSEAKHALDKPSSKTATAAALSANSSPMKLFKNSPVKAFSPQKLKAAHSVVNPDLVKQLKDKSVEVLRLQIELQNLRTEISTLEDNLSKTSEARAKDQNDFQAELAIYGDRELNFISRELAVHSKNTQLGNNILHLEKRILELEQQLKTETAQSSHPVSGNQAQFLQGSGSGSATAATTTQQTNVQNFAQLVLVQHHHHNQYVNYVQTANIAHISGSTAANLAEPRVSTPNKLGASPNKSCSQF